MALFGSAISAIVLGAIGWIALEFVGRPVRKFFDLRGKVKEQMLHFEDLYYSWGEFVRDYDTEEMSKQTTAIREARQIFTALANELIAFGQSEELAVRILKFCGFNPVVAGKQLSAMADGFGTFDENREANYKKIGQALRF